MEKKYTVNAIWDHEADVWSVSDSNVPGLATDAPNLDVLHEKLKVLIPELIELNCPNDCRKAIPYRLCTEHLICEKCQSFISF